MEERKFINLRKEEFGVKEYIKRQFGKGKVSKVQIDYTSVGEKITVSTHKPGLIIGKKGESIERLTNVLKKKFKMENPHVDIDEITQPEFDAQLTADDIALQLERFGSMRFKAIAYRWLPRIQRAGALGAEIVLSGKLPSDRAKTWRFKFGYLKKTGDSSNVVDKAEAVAKTKQGIVGVKVSILSPYVKLHDRISVNEELLEEIRANTVSEEDVEKVVKKTKKKVKKGEEK
jgi:small subunit ribosomal protein S3